MNKRSVGLGFHIDTNRINARQNIHNMNRLEKWSDSGVISLEKSDITFIEASAGSNQQRKRKAMNGFYSISYEDTLDEKQKLLEIEEILFPNGAETDNQKNDVKIVFNAYKYKRILITNDGGSKKQPGGILGNAKRLKEEMCIDVMTDEDAVVLVERRIKNRNITCK